MLVLEALEHAQARGARIYAELVGYGANCDAYHMTQPSPDGAGRRRLHAAGARRRRHRARRDVDYINAHGTATPYNDETETQAIKRVFGEHAARLAVSSTKSMTGHLLGGAGRHRGGLHRADAAPRRASRRRSTSTSPIPACDLDYVPHQARRGRASRRAVQLLRLRRHQRLAGRRAAGRPDGRRAPRPPPALRRRQGRRRQDDGRLRAARCSPRGAASARWRSRWTSTGRLPTLLGGRGAGAARRRPRRAEPRACSSVDGTRGARRVPRARSSR